MKNYIKPEMISMEIKPNNNIASLNMSLTDWLSNHETYSDVQITTYFLMS